MNYFTSPLSDPSARRYKDATERFEKQRHAIEKVRRAASIAIIHSSASLQPAVEKPTGTVRITGSYDPNHQATILPFERKNADEVTSTHVEPESEDQSFEPEAYMAETNDAPTPTWEEPSPEVVGHLTSF